MNEAGRRDPMTPGEIQSRRKDDSSVPGKHAEIGVSPFPNTPRSRLLLEAMTITHHDRNANYGNPEDNFQHIANLWNDYLRVKRPQAAVIDAKDVAVMNMLIKVARLGNNSNHRDSVLDIAGYAACLADCQEQKGQQQMNQLQRELQAGKTLPGTDILRYADAALAEYIRNRESGPITNAQNSAAGSQLDTSNPNKSAGDWPTQSR